MDGKLADLLRRLYGLGGQYLSDALPGGSLNPEWTPERTQMALSGLLDVTPVVGDIKSGYEGVQAARQGDMVGAGLGALGALPMIPNMGGILKRADLKAGMPEFGQWQLDRVERRTRPEEYIDASGENRTKYVADMDRAEQSWGSGQPVANIYWMKDKRTGEIKPFGDDTAHQAMGLQSSTVAKKKFNEQLQKQQDDWYAEQRKAFGYEWHNAPVRFQQIREWLLKGQINEDRALELMKKYSNK
jgi:hypothetical protein